MAVRPASTCATAPSHALPGLCGKDEGCVGEGTSGGGRRRDPGSGDCFERDLFFSRGVSLGGGQGARHVLDCIRYMIADERSIFKRVYTVRGEVLGDARCGGDG